MTDISSRRRAISLPGRVQVLPILLLCALASPARALQTGTSCGCPEQLDALAAKVEANHPGYHLEVIGTAREVEYRRHRIAMAHRAAGVQAERTAADPELACLRVLQDYVAWFRDPHLFVGGRTPLRSAANSARVTDAAPRVDVDESRVMEYLASVGADLDPVEGAWLDPLGVKIAIVRETGLPAVSSVLPEVRPTLPETSHGKAAEDRFVAVALASATPGWAAGDVMAVLERLPDGSYEAVLYDDLGRPTRPHFFTRGLAGGARLQRDGLLLHMAPVTWGKLHPVRPGTEHLADPADPRAPVARVLDDGTVVFHIPSHDPSRTLRLHALVERYRGALDRAPRLVLDLRGNEGGSSRFTDPLLPWIDTPDRRPARYPTVSETRVLSSPDNVAHFQRQGWAPRGLVERMRAHPGELVPFADEVEAVDGGIGAAAATTASGAAEVRDPELPSGPPQVAVLTDAMSVSAAEAFVLRIMGSTRVTLFGAPTGGSIDYQSVAIVRFGCPESGLYVGYPTMVGERVGPEGGVNATGIVPDVVIPNGVDDPVAWLVAYLGRQGS